MKIWVVLWHHKHGTNVEAAPTRDLATSCMAEQVLDAMDLQKIDAQDEAHTAFAKGNTLRVLELWKYYGGVEDSFEFLETPLRGA